MGDFTDSPQPGLPTEQRALLGSSGSHTKWPKPPAEKKAEVRATEGKCLPCLQMGQEWRCRDPWAPLSWSLSSDRASLSPRRTATWSG